MCEGPEDQGRLRGGIWPLPRRGVSQGRASSPQSCRRNGKELDSQYGSPRVESVG